MNTEELLNRYFEGETSAEEEKMLRETFRSGKAPAELSVYRPLFAYFDEEIRREKTVVRLKPILQIAAAVVVLIAVGTWLWRPDVRQADPCAGASGYVIIEGVCFADTEQAKAMALEALREVGLEGDEGAPLEGFFDNDN